MIPDHPLSDEANFSQFILEQAERYYSNMDQADKLFRLYARLARNEGIEGTERIEEEEEVTSAILRSAVVFVHATLEDLLRSVESDLLPYSDRKALETIPLAGTNRREKFTLGDLAAYRGKSILEVIRESVSEHLSTISYSNTERITARLKRLGIEIKEEDSNRLYPQLETLIQRRHQIVHRADKTPQGEFETIKPEQVWEWMCAVSEFMGKFIQAINPP